MSRISARLPVFLNRFSWLMAAFLVGFVVSSRELWPYSIIENGLAAAKDLSANAESYVGLFPTRHIYYDPFPGAGVTIEKPAKMQPGVTFLTGFFDEQHMMKVLAPDGTELHRWVERFGKIFKDLDYIQPATDRPWNEWLTDIHGAHPFRDGSVVFNFDEHGLVKVNACGQVIWKLRRMTSHSISLADDGTLWVPSRIFHQQNDPRFPLLRAPFFEDQLLHISPDGKILREISLPALLRKNDLSGIEFPTGFQHMGNMFYDFTHVNDAEVLSKKLAPAFPMFRAGDILVSMRQLDLLFVFDPRTEKVKWHQTGPWLRQHDPGFLKDGTISVFDNHADDTEFGSILGGSRILKVDPATGKTWTIYADPGGKHRRRFFSNIMGKQQTLVNGNLLITEPLGGRVFEVTPSGEIVWQYINRFNKDHVSLVSGAMRLPADYFDFSHSTCSALGASS